MQVHEHLAVAGVSRFDLAVNPLSCLLLHLKPLNDTGTLANFQTMLGIAGALDRVAVLHNGVSIKSFSGRDLVAMNYFRHGIQPMQATHLITTNFRRSMVIPLLFGDQVYSQSSCFPASKRGELTLELDVDIADTGYDGMRISVESIELPGAKPKEYEKQVQLAATFGSTGFNDIELPLGNLVRSLLLFGTTGFTGAAPAPTFGRMAVMLDNEQFQYMATDFEVQHMMHGLKGGSPPSFDARLVGTTVDGNAGTSVPSDGANSSIGAGGWQNYALLDFDPTMNDMYSINTKGKDRFHLEVNAETADAWRIIPTERIKV
jgi:hypothetical protein